MRAIRPEHSACRARHCTRWSLRAIMLVARDASVRADFGRRHLQHVELRRNLEQAAGKRSVGVKRRNVTENVFVTGARGGGGEWN